MFGRDDDGARDEDASGIGKGKLFAMLLAGLGALGFFLKRKRERELDEALWEEPEAL